MVEQVVVNTGPLVALAAADALRILEKLPFQFVAPLEVQQELAEGEALGHLAVNASSVRFTSLHTLLNPIAIANLDRGEAAVIQLALENQVALVCLDEKKGRRAALAVGLRVVGSLGLLGRAKELGHLQQVRPYVEAMLSNGSWFDEELLARFYQAVAE